jgi:thymidylate synthase
MVHDKRLGSQEDITLAEYMSHEAIKAPMAA